MGIASKEDYLKAAQLFHWAQREHYQMWFTGSLNRHRRTEVMLPRLVKKGKLVAIKYGKRLVYSVPRRTKGIQLFIDHGLACTEGLVRLWRARMNSIVIPERFFKGTGCVPEFGIRYPNGKLLLYEYCTQNNFEHSGVVKGKITKYLQNLPVIEEKYDAEAIVLFVTDIHRNRVDNFLKKIWPAGEPFFFTDYETFLKVPIGEQITAPIYIWGEDIKSYPLSG